MKKFLVTLCSVVLTAGLTVSAFAATTATPAATSTTDSSVTSQIQGKGFKGGRFGKISAEERAAFEAACQERQSKWSALTDEQREEVYKLEDQITALKKQMVDKYEKFGIIDSETATERKAQITEGSNEMRTDKKMPGMGMGMGRGRGLGKGCGK